MNLRVLFQPLRPTLNSLNAQNIEQLLNRATYAAQGLISLHEFVTSAETDYMNLLSGATYLASAITPTLYPRAIKTGHAISGLHFLYKGISTSAENPHGAPTTALAIRGFTHLYSLVKSNRQPIQFRPPQPRQPVRQNPQISLDVINYQEKIQP